MNPKKLLSNFVISFILVALAFSHLGSTQAAAAPDSIFPPTSNVLAQFEFTNNTLDSSGNNRNAALIGAATYTTTTCGTGLQLDALGEGVDWSTYAALLVHPFTIEMILTPSQTASYARLFNFNDANDNGWYYNSQGIQAYPNPVLGAGTVLPNQRHYIAFVSTSSTNMDVYFQGVLLGNTGFGYTPPGPNAIFFKDNFGGSEQMVGVVDALRISSVSRTPAEITAVQQRVANCADNVPPSLTSFARQNPPTSPTNADILVFRATFSEGVTNIDTSDFAINGTTTATITNAATVNSSTYDITVSGGDLAGFNGMVSINLSGTQNITDLAGNALPTSEPLIDENYTIDNTIPTVTLNQAAGQADPTNSSPINFTVVFSEAVTGFGSGDVTLSGAAGATTATITEVAPNNGTTYNVAVSGMTSDGTVIASIPAGIATDLSNNSNSASTSTDNTVTYDTTGPTVTINQAAGQADPTGSSPINFTVVFTEAVSGFASGDVTLSGTAGGTTAVVTEIAPNNGTTFNVAVSGMSSNGTVIASIAAGVAADASGNTNSASTSTDNTVTYAPIGPSVTINQAAGQVDPTNSSPINFTVVFSEAVTGFATGDVTLSGTAGSTTAVVTEIAPNNGTTYNVAMSGMTTDGTVIATVPESVATNSTGAGNNASTSTDNMVTYDTSGPTVTINQAAGQADPTSSSPINFEVVFSEDVTGFTGNDVTLGGTAGATTSVVTGSGNTFNVAVSGMTGNGTVIASIAAGVAVDNVGNGNSASTSTDNTVNYDTTGPAVTINQAAGQVDPTSVGPINFTVVFSESVIGFATGDVSLSGTAGATTAAVTEIAPNDGTTFNVAVSGMSSGGTVTASVPAGRAQNTLGNGNQASTSTDNTVTYDLGYPTVSGSTPANNATVSPGPTKLTVQFSEDVKNDGSAEAANNTANYLLVERGANHSFDTLSCAGGVVSDDTKITVNSAAYTNNGGSGPFAATLNINSAAALPVGSYRLFVCGTTSIEDLANNELNNGQSDSMVTFSVTARSQASSSSSVLPKTGFPMDKVTALPVQPADKAYASTDLMLEIPRLGVKMPIVGVPFKDGVWDVSWLDKNAGWLNSSAFPTWNGNSVLTGHVWDALNRPGPFAGLKDLKYGDQIKIHAFGQVFTYEVRENSLISPTNTMTVFTHKEKSWITLVTCEDYKESTKEYLSRRMVRAVLVNVTAEK